MPYAVSSTYFFFLFKKINTVSMPICRQKISRPACAFTKQEILVCLLALLYPRHTKYVGVYSFRFSVRLFVRSFVRTFVCSFIRSFVFPSQGQSFCVKVYKTSYFKDPLMDLVHIWHDGRYRSKIFISTIPIPGVALGSRSRT